MFLIRKAFLPAYIGFALAGCNLPDVGLDPESGERDLSDEIYRVNCPNCSLGSSSRGIRFLNG